MKNLFSSTFSVKAIFAGLLVTLFFVFGPTNVSAQSTKDNTYDVPQGNFVNVDQAIIRLDLALENLKISMWQLDPHSDAYKTMEMRFRYFDNIRTTLLEGKGTDSATVANAIASAMSVLSTPGNSILGAKTDIDLKDMAPFKQDAINLLRQ